MMNRNEIKTAAESIACGVFDRGGSLDQAEVEISRAFADDTASDRELALGFARRWLAAVQDVPGN